MRYSARMHAIVACQMEFQYYPMDIQICPLSIESCAYYFEKALNISFIQKALFIAVSYDNLKMALKWSSAGVSVSPELKLLQYHIYQPLELEEKNVYTVEKSGKCILLYKILQFVILFF